MTKTKDFISTLPQAASNLKDKGQKGHQNGSAPKQEILDSGDSDDSGDSGSLPVFTTLDSLPPNRVNILCAILCDD